MKLLSLSRSFVVGKNGPGCYKMVEQRLLPKFDSPRESKTQGSPQKSSVMPTSGAGGFASQTGPSSPGTTAASMTNRVARQPTESRSGPLPRLFANAQNSGAEPRKRAGFKLDRLFRRLLQAAESPFLQRTSQRFRVKTPWQAELSLDSVKVVRNDLWDADFEVVPAKTGATIGSQRPVRAVAAGPQPSGVGLSRVTARWINARRVRV